MRLHLEVVCYAVALAFKANRVNIMFGNIKKQFSVCVGPIYFMLKPPVHPKHLRAAFRVYAK
jgi:hypothetical protein